MTTGMDREGAEAAMKEILSGRVVLGVCAAASAVAGTACSTEPSFEVGDAGHG